MIQNKSGINKKILFVHQGFELYGSDKMLLLNIKAASEKYPEKEIIVVLQKKGILSYILENKYNVEVLIKTSGVIRKYDLKRFNFSAFYRIISFFRLIRFLNSFELVYINSIVIIDYILAARFIKTNVFIHVHELPVGFAVKVFSKLLSFSKAKLIFVSEASKNSFNTLKNKNQIIIWNGIKAIKEIEIGENNKGKIRLLLIGRINTWKGQALLIKAISLLKFNVKENIYVRIVGDVFLNQHYLINKLFEQINHYKLQNMIEILPFTQTPEIHYNWADVVVIPSILPEPFGLVAIEAMSLGKLVIASNHGGLKEIIDDNVNGILFEPRNEKDLAEKISEIINNPNKIKELGENSLKKFQSQFNEEIYKKKIIEYI